MNKYFLSTGLLGLVLMLSSIRAMEDLTFEEQSKIAEHESLIQLAKEQQKAARKKDQEHEDLAIARSLQDTFDKNPAVETQEDLEFKLVCEISAAEAAERQVKKDYSFAKALARSEMAASKSTQASTLTVPIVAKKDEVLQISEDYVLAKALVRSEMDAESKQGLVTKKTAGSEKRKE